VLKIEKIIIKVEEMIIKIEKTRVVPALFVGVSSTEDSEGPKVPRAVKKNIYRAQGAARGQEKS
jgi:hypothetical protein